MTTMMMLMMTTTTTTMMMMMMEYLTVDIAQCAWWTFGGCEQGGARHFNEQTSNQLAETIQEHIGEVGDRFACDC
eukprot:1246062-Amphidinium_carterae.1